LFFVIVVVVFCFASSAHSYFRTLGHFLEWPRGDNLKGDTRSWTTNIGEKIVFSTEELKSPIIVLSIHLLVGHLNNHTPKKQL